MRKYISVWVFSGLCSILSRICLCQYIAIAIHNRTSGHTFCVRILSCIIRTFYNVRALRQLKIYDICHHSKEQRHKHICHPRKFLISCALCSGSFSVFAVGRFAIFSAHSFLFFFSSQFLLCFVLLVTFLSSFFQSFLPRLPLIYTSPE